MKPFIFALMLSVTVLVMSVAAQANIRWVFNATNCVSVDCNLSVYKPFESSVLPPYFVGNSNYIDSVLFEQSGTVVTLAQIRLGGVYNDSDTMLLAYMVAGDSTDNIDVGWLGNNMSHENLTSQGWNHLSDYSPVGISRAKPINVASDSSSYELVSAFNSEMSTNTWFSGNDYFKMRALYGNALPSLAVQVFAPGSFVLLALGLPLLRVRWRN